MIKKTLLSLSILLAGTLAQAWTLDELVGTYNITHEEIPVVSQVMIEADGSIALLEQSFDGTNYYCEGTAELKNDVIYSSMICEGGEVYNQEIDLSGVNALNQFKAPVYSSLFDGTAEMNFEKVGHTSEKTNSTTTAKTYSCLIPNRDLPAGFEGDLPFELVVGEDKVSSSMFGDIISQDCDQEGSNVYVCRDDENMPYTYEVISDSTVVLQVGHMLPATEATCE